MKTKNIFCLIALFCGLQLSAQDTTENKDSGIDSSKCKECFSLYNESLKQKMYKESYKHWHCVMEICPGFKVSLYGNGLYLVRKLSANASEARKKDLMDTAVWVYKTKPKHFETGYEWTAKYGSYVMREIKDYNKAYEILKPVIDEWDENITEFSYIYRFSHSLLYRFAKADDRDVQDSLRLEGIRYYDVLNERLDQALANGVSKSGVKKIRGLVEKHFLKFASSCENLVPVLEEQSKKLPEDKDQKIETIKKYMGIMEKIGCEGEDLYGNLLGKLTEFDPTADVSYRAGKYNREQGKTTVALNYFKQAVELCDGCEDEDKYKFAVLTSHYKSGSYKTTFNYAKGVGGSYKGKAYKYMAMCIAALSESCGETRFMRQMNYCLAYDYLLKAENAGEPVGGLKSNYKSNFPTTKMAFAEGFNEGESFTMSCWGESTKFRNAGE